VCRDFGARRRDNQATMPLQARAPSVLFICTGNICRSPTAHALLVHKAREAGFSVEVDSAAISNEECGNPADRRSVAEAKRRGIAMPERVARQVTAEDLVRFDHVIAMTRAHCASLRRLASPEGSAKVRLLLDGRDVPDPWYGDQRDFVAVFDLIDGGVDALLTQLRHPAQDTL